MIPNHPKFLEAIADKKKVGVKFYSTADSGVVDRICAPISYGLGNDNSDGLNRYWLWDYASTGGSHVLGLLPPLILDIQVLGEVFDPAGFIVAAPPVPVSPTAASPPVGG